MHIRPGSKADLPFIRAIQATSLFAAQWDPGDDNLLVAESGNTVVGFLLWRAVAADEAEILNLAVQPEFRRQGIALELLNGVSLPRIFLEVRESNHAARALYLRAGFEECGHRRRYYDNPSEDGIVMRLQS
jgi:[ribosomal protein S18]-alanine N-acetyltransferase